MHGSSGCIRMKQKFITDVQNKSRIEDICGPQQLIFTGFVSYTKVKVCGLSIQASLNCILN